MKFNSLFKHWLTILSLQKIAQAKSPDEMTFDPHNVSCLEKMEDLVADGDIIAGECDGEISDTSGRL